MSDQETDLESEFRRLESEMKGIVQQHQNALQRLSSLEDEVDELRHENHELREELQERDRLNQMLKGVQEQAANTPEKRAAIILQNMFNDAKARENTGQTPVAKYDAEQCKTALGGGAVRQDVYYAMKEAVPRSIPNAAVEYVRTPRSADQKNHVKMDLRSGAVEGHTVAGHRIRSGGEVS